MSFFKRKRMFANYNHDDNNDDGESLLVFDISETRRVRVRSLHGKVYVDIREFYEKDGKQLPGRKGISLTMDQWKVLCEHTEKIDQAVSNVAACGPVHPVKATEARPLVQEPIEKIDQAVSNVASCGQVHPTKVTTARDRPIVTCLEAVNKHNFPTGRKWKRWPSAKH